MKIADLVDQLNALHEEMLAAGLFVVGTGKIRSPEDTLEIENRWLRRKVARLERQLASLPSPEEK